MLNAQEKMTLVASVPNDTADASHVQPSAAAPEVDGEVIDFGRFRVVPSTRTLLVNGQTVELGSRTFDLLMVLVRARGTVVAKDAIVAQVWPAMVVDESNLRFQIAALRRALGADRGLVKTVSGRGYILAVDRSSEPPVADDSYPSRSTPFVDTLITNTQGRPSAVLIMNSDGNLREAIGNFLRSMGLRLEVFASVEAYAESTGGGRACPPSQRRIR